MCNVNDAALYVCLYDYSCSPPQKNAGSPRCHVCAFQVLYTTEIYPHAALQHIGGYSLPWMEATRQPGPVRNKAVHGLPSSMCATWLLSLVAGYQNRRQTISPQSAFAPSAVCAVFVLPRFLPDWRQRHRSQPVHAFSTARLRSRRGRGSASLSVTCGDRTRPASWARCLAEPASPPEWFPPRRREERDAASICLFVCWCMVRE